MKKWKNPSTVKSKNKVLYAKEKTNCYYPIGENTVFIPFINNFMESSLLVPKNFYNERNFLDELVEWIFDIGSAMQDYSLAYKYYILFGILGKKLRSDVHYMEEYAVKNYRDYKSPLFFN